MFSVDDDSAFMELSKKNNQASNNYVKFYQSWVRNNFQSDKQGIEVGEFHDFILIVSPGNDKTEVRRKVTDVDKYDYPIAWARYQEGKENQLTGTPVEMLPGIAQGLVDSLKSQYILTIEQLANISDGNIKNIGIGGHALREKAKAYLEKSSVDMLGLKKELEETKANLDAANDIIRELQTTLASRKKPGPKPKVKT